MGSSSGDSPINAALRAFEAAEANLEKLERIFRQLQELVPGGIVFGSNPAYDHLCRAYEDVLDALPAIDGWKPAERPVDLNDLAQWRMDAREIDEISAIVSTEEAIDEPARELARYRYDLTKKRRQLIRDALAEVIARVDSAVRQLHVRYCEAVTEKAHQVDDPELEVVRQSVQEIETMLGSSLPRPNRWSDLRRHLHFGQIGDLKDIVNFDWPQVKSALNSGLYDENEPVPVEVSDLATLAAAKPTGTVATRLNWETLSAEEFERLMFALISGEPGYENPEWLMKTSAPDRGRDLSVTRVAEDRLAGIIRSRVIIQCKHWTSTSISVSEIATLSNQMKLWEPPRVDVLVIATSGRFSSDAVAYIERHNNDDRSLRIEMWPESHLERLLAQRPSLIADFGLR